LMRVALQNSSTPCRAVMRRRDAPAAGRSAGDADWPRACAAGADRMAGSDQRYRSRADSCRRRSSRAGARGAAHDAPAGRQALERRRRGTLRLELLYGLPRRRLRCFGGSAVPRGLHRLRFQLRALCGGPAAGRSAAPRLAARYGIGRR
jgi:hypothetical protein